MIELGIIDQALDMQDVEIVASQKLSNSNDFNKLPHTIIISRNDDVELGGCRCQYQRWYGIDSK
jgi:hypothetical protein